jgi:hypothetical protein
MADMPTPLPSFTLEEARSAIEACLSANAAAHAAAVVDRVARVSLNAHEERLRGWLSIAMKESAPSWFFGTNWNGPKLSDVIHSCERHREMGRGDKMRKVA